MPLILSCLTATIVMMASCIASAEDYSLLLLQAQASIFPKIIMLDSNVDQKLVDNAIVLRIVYEARDSEQADIMKRLIETKYEKNIGEYELKVELSHSGDVNHFNDKATAFYVMKMEAEDFNDVVDYASANNRVCFSYRYKDLESGSLISLLLKEKVYIYINKEQLVKYDVNFKPVFYKIAKVVE